MRELDRTPTCRLYLALARFQLSPIRPSQDVRSFAHSGPRMQPRASLGEHLFSKIRGLSNIPTEISAVTNCQVQLFSNHYPEHRTLGKVHPCTQNTSFGAPPGSESKPASEGGLAGLFTYQAK